MIALPTLLLSGLTAASPGPLPGEDDVRLATTALAGSLAGVAPEPGIGGPDLGPDAGRSAAGGAPAFQVLEADRLLADRAAVTQVAAEQASRDAAARAEAERPRFSTPIDTPAGSPYGPRWGRLHAGLDFPAPIDTPIRAVADGVVEQAGPASGYGNLVLVRHADGTVTAYGHMRVISVAPGQPVRAGQTIALVGNEGMSTGPHLHLEVRVDGGAVDPRPWLAARGVAV
jgi:murein DD-endopeptidase MepM/ murein hydrolase activator NlpD